VDAELGEAGFYRVHESFLINTEHIVEIEDKLNNAHVYLPEKVPIARNRKVDFLNHLNNSRIKMF
jgi:DNA-binding LytR/AlgR family response regulator